MRPGFHLHRIPASLAVLVLAGCGGSKHAAVVDLTTHQDLSVYKIVSLSGTRNGDRLDARAFFSDSASMLTVNLHFVIGSPTRLEAGDWKWTRDNRLLNGSVAARSVTFLGGQDGPPSIGGSFELFGSGQPALYRVTIPMTELKTRLTGDRPAR